MRMLFGFIVIGAGLIAAEPTLAYEHKCPAIGTEVRTTLIPSGAPIRYDGANGLWCLRSRGGQPINSEFGHVRFYPRTMQGSDLSEKNLDAASQLWPLIPGTEISFPYNATGDGSSAGSTRTNNTYVTEITVGQPQRVTVPGGTYSAVPIEFLVRGQLGNYHQSSQTYYYAPELGTNVKYEYRLISGSAFDQPKSWELISIKPPPGS
jgi:hypothetical protein